jgi:hypothetical protein
MGYRFRSTSMWANPIIMLSYKKIFTLACAEFKVSHMIVLKCSAPPMYAVSAAEVASLSTYSMKLLSSWMHKYSTIRDVKVCCILKRIIIIQQEQHLLFMKIYSDTA